MKKVLVSLQKGCTFAPAFPEREGLRKKGTGRAEFIESLRPAQDTEGGREAVRGKEPFEGTPIENIKAEPEIQRNK